jgi:hypothetical protein
VEIGDERLTYSDRIEQAIEARDIYRLIKYAYGDACRCQTVKGEPDCLRKMFATALRKKIAPHSRS